MHGFVPARAQDEAEKAFRRIDADGSGELDMEEMGKISRYFGRPLTLQQLVSKYALRKI